MAYRSSRTRSTYDYESPMEYYRRRAEAMEPREHYDDEDVFLEKMMNILSGYPNIGVPREPTPIMGTVLLGSTANAENIPQLKALGITYLLNCAGGGPVGMRKARGLYGPETGIMGLEELGLDDKDTSDISGYFGRAHQFLDFTRTKNAKVLIYCPGVSRSGAIGLSYMVKSGVPLLEACKILKDKRRCVLTNHAFMKQVLDFANDHGMLDFDSRRISAPRYGRRLDIHRIRSAHMPLYI